MVRGIGTNLHAVSRIASAILLLIGLGTCLAFAQGSTATMSGVVRDASGALVPGVNIAVKNLDSGQTRTIVSSAD